MTTGVKAHATCLSSLVMNGLKMISLTCLVRFRDHVEVDMPIKSCKNKSISPPTLPYQYKIQLDAVTSNRLHRIARIHCLTFDASRTQVGNKACIAPSDYNLAFL